MKLPTNLGMVLLAAWLILFGILTAPFLRLSFAYSGDLLAVLAIAAGVLLLMQRREINFMLISAIEAFSASTR